MELELINPLSDNAPAFDEESVYDIIKQVVDAKLHGKTFVHANVSAWHDAIVENVLVGLAKQGRGFKYIATCLIAHNTGSTQTAHTSFWDTDTDGFTKYRFESATLVCLATVYGMAY
mmetsp:Transcript_34472/g.50471  ORF Transcript_34472/g.50471 Transcript_34472/m.50471 type:complete len:117 (-) Transcript_34472:79-429(-)|eukprot:CAMPEP_0173056322 /NCGR_PEP_ID=MMETSP1102-20130122/66_1 /TAXON_ID=49646 /ORGANISM="Geminigera sp., Strain Caron Lab Isolate" /LENGTH=116 /DNA_ID=CAMNT_0013921605 /DNA_START=127 /DNA_END=477 /DNA_ORIENTATION=-